MTNKPSCRITFDAGDSAPHSEPELNGFLDIFVVPGGGLEPAVRLQVRGPDACWCNLTPDQAHAAGLKLIEAAMAAKLAKVAPAPLRPRRRIIPK